MGWQQEAPGWSPCGGGTGGQGHELSSIRVSPGPGPRVCGVSGAQPGGLDALGSLGGVCVHKCVGVFVHTCANCVHTFASVCMHVQQLGHPTLGQGPLCWAKPRWGGPCQGPSRRQEGWPQAGDMHPGTGMQPHQPWHQPRPRSCPSPSHPPANFGQLQAAPKLVPSLRWLTAL